MFIHSLKRDIIINQQGHGDIPLLIIGPANLFKKDNMLSSKFNHILTIYYLDLFALDSIHNINLNNDNSIITLNDFVEAIEQVRIKLALKNIFLFAHSAMGMLAIEYALKYPLNLSGNILIGFSPDWSSYKDEHCKEFLTENADEGRKILYGNDQNTVKEIINNDSLSKQELYYKKYYSRRALFFHNPNNTSNTTLWDNINLDMELVEKYFSLIKAIDLRKCFNMNSYNVPTMLVLGLYDFSCPITLWTDTYRDILARLDYYIFENSGHFPMKEESDSFFNCIHHFLNRAIKKDSDYTPQI